MSRDNRLKVLRAMPGSQSQIVERTGLGQATVCRWCEDLVARKEAHVLRFYTPEHGGPQRPIYEPGPMPAGQRMRKPYVERDPVKRQATYRRKKRADGSWEDILANRRKRNALARKPKPDPLALALFGGAR